MGRFLVSHTLRKSDISKIFVYRS